MNLSKKYRYGLLAGVMLCLSSPLMVEAETVSQKEASRIAQTFFNAAHGQLMGKPNLVYNGKRLTTDRLFSPFYIYNLPKGGFVIISAENKAMPILGYSLKDNFDPDAMGEATKALLSGYARDIEYIRYDSRVPEEAIATWNDINSYIGNILTSVYTATDPVFSLEEAAELISNVETSGHVEDYSSDIFSPSQWRDVIDDELTASKSVAIGIVTDKEIVPAIVHGQKGDYYRIELDGRNDWLMRLMATEYLSGGQVAFLANPFDSQQEDEEEAAFLLHDDFMKQVKEEEESRLRMFEERINSVEPVIRAVGGGHFEIRLPEKVIMARIYNMNGMMVNRHTYSDTDTAVISLDGSPYGFYFVILNGESGKPYGFKLYK